MKILEPILELLSTNSLAALAFFLFFSLLAWWYQHNKRIFLPDGGQLRGEAEQRRLNDLIARKQWIENRHFENIYLNLLEHMLDWLSAHFTHDQERLKQNHTKKSWIESLFGVQPFTEGSYLFCLRFALIYPWMAFFIVWLSGGSGEFDGLRLLPESPLTERMIVLLGFVIMLWSYSKSTYNIILWTAYLIIGIYALHTFASIGVFAFAGLYIFLLASSAHFPIFLAFSFIILFFLISSISTSTVIGLTIVIAASDYILTRYHTTSRAIVGYWIVLNLFHLLLLIACIAWMLDESVVPEHLLLLIFMIMLPLVNAFMDWISLGFTRGFLYAILQQTHTGMKALLFTSLDTILALIFLVTIVSLIVLLFAGINAASFHWSGQIFVNLQNLFDGLEKDPLALEYTWIHFMMLSTLIPTLVHFSIAGAAAVMVFPNAWRDSILQNWDDRGDAQIGALWYVTIIPALGIIAPFFALWALYSVLSAHGGLIGYGLLNWAQELSTIFL